MKDNSLIVPVTTWIQVEKVCAVDLNFLSLFIIFVDVNVVKHGGISVFLVCSFKNLENVTKYYNEIMSVCQVKNSKVKKCPIQDCLYNPTLAHSRFLPLSVHRVNMFQQLNQGGRGRRLPFVQPLHYLLQILVGV